MSKTWGFTAAAVVVVGGVVAFFGASMDDHNTATMAAEEDLLAAGYTIENVSAPWKFYFYNEELASVQMPYSQRDLKYRPKGGYADIKITLPAEQIDPLHELPTAPQVCVVRFGLWHDKTKGWHLLPDSGEFINGQCPHDLNDLLHP